MPTDDLGDLDVKLGGLSDKVLDLLQGSAGDKIGLQMRSDAWNNAPWGSGALRQSLTYPSKERKTTSSVRIEIRSGTYYTIFQEYGTGIKGDPRIPHVQKSDWWQYRGTGSDGQPRYIHRYAMRPKHFMTNAVRSPAQISIFKKEIAKAVKESFRL